MANKKISELTTRTPSLSDLMLVGDPSSGYSFKCTVTALATIIETDIADGYVTLGTTQTISGAKTFSNNLTLTSVSNAGVDTDKFLVLSGSNVVNFRTGAEVLSDIGAQAALTNPITGTGTSGQVSYFNGTNSITSSPTFAFTPTSQLLVNNSVTAASAIARGINATPTLTAAANNDVLVGIDVNPTFTNGAFTGVTNWAARITGSLAGVTGYYSTGAGFGSHFLEIVSSNSATGIVNFRRTAGANGTYAYQLNNGSAYFSTSNITGESTLGTSGGGFFLNFYSGGTEAMRIFGATRNVLIQNGGTFTDAGFRLDIAGSVRFGANLTANDILGNLNFRNGSNAAYIMQENSTSRSIQIPGTGGNAHWIFNNSGAGWGLQGIFNNGTFLTRGDLVTFTNANFAGNSIQVIGINGTQAQNNRNIYIGNNGAQYANEKGTNIRLIAGIGGTSGGDKVGGDIYLTPGAGGGVAAAGNVILAHTGSASQGNVMIGTTTAGGKFTIQPTNDQVGMSISGSSLTGSNAQSLVSLSQTWNTTGNPTAFLLNITNTASGNNSYLLDLQVGGIPQFTVFKGGEIKTSSPAGGVAQTWKLGSVQAVTPTSPNRTIEVEVNGTTYYLHAKTTND